MNIDISITHRRGLAPAHRRKSPGFTLIELLIVIAIIAILAAMVFPITKALNRTKLRTRARGELAQLETAIEAYKAKIGVYPPDNPNSTLINQLYYELVGTRVTAAEYVTLDGSARFTNTPGAFASVFGPQVLGFVNSAKSAEGDEASGGQNFFKTLKSAQTAEIKKNIYIFRALASTVPWPSDQRYQPIQTPYIPVRPVSGINLWRYNSHAPTNNPNSYDLWIDIIVDAKTNRISNWSREPLINPPPY